MRISDDQLGVIISSQIRENGLNDIFDASVVEKIKSKVKEAFRQSRMTSSEVVIPEADGNLTNPVAGNTFPYEVEPEEEKVPPVEIEPQPAMEIGSQPTDVAYDPKVYTPELPDVLKHVKPAQLVAMELSDVEQNGEALAAKPMRMMDNIDMRKSMLDLWKEEGSTKADVFIMKYEKAGELTFDYASGTAVFVPNRSDPATFNSGGEKENPYSEENPNGPNKFNEPSREDIEAYVKTSVNVEDIVKKVAMELMAKAYEEQSSENAKAKMAMTPPDAPQASDEIPPAIYEAYHLGHQTKDVHFVSSKNGATHYRHNGKEYIVIDASSLAKNKV